MQLWLDCSLNGREQLGCTSLSALTHVHTNKMISGVPFSAPSNTCWVMVIQNSKTPPQKKSTLIAKSMWNWVWGLKSLVCSESMHVLERLLIVQPDHTYANSLSWSQSIERITASIRHTERLYTGPYNHWIELRASVKESVFLSIHITIHGPEREKERSNVLPHRCFWIIFKDLFSLKMPPSAQWSGTAFW